MNPDGSKLGNKSKRLNQEKQVCKQKQNQEATEAWSSMRCYDTTSGLKRKEED